MVRIAIVDYGVGNLRSIRRGIELAGASAEITRDSRAIRQASAIVLPGVGAFKSAMEQLDRDLIRQCAEEGKPFLGICLGLQLFMERSEEESGEGLGLLEGDVVALPPKEKVPQMGWNTIEVKRDDPFLEGVKSGSYVYFVHSYYTRPKDPQLVVATTEYGVRFPSVVAKGALVGTQFRPEKSGRVGLRMLSNFVQTVKR
jgi:glutamine amidotransferase